MNLVVGFVGSNAVIYHQINNVKQHYHPPHTTKQKNIASIENNAIGSTVEVTSLWNKGVASLREMTGQKKE